MKSTGRLVSGFGFDDDVDAPNGIGKAVLRRKFPWNYDLAGGGSLRRKHCYQHKQYGTVSFIL